jgi:SAM-dependent methyltransferase
MGEPVASVGFLEIAAVNPTDAALLVRGWVMASSGAVVDAFEVECDGAAVPGITVQAQLPSPDVQAAHPGSRGAERARFLIRGRLPGGPGDVPQRVTVTPVFAGERGCALEHARPTVTSAPESAAWFDSLYRRAADDVLSFLAWCGIPVEGRTIADIGSGDGILDLGVMHRALPARLVGFDIKPHHVEELAALATQHGVPAVPAALEFRTCGERTLPAKDGEFDLVFSWSAFEHMLDPTAVAREIRRVLSPRGALMVQVWPLYYSPHGSHLWNWFPEGFVHLLGEPASVEAQVRGRTPPGATFGEDMLDEFRRLNRMTVDDLQRALTAAGFRVARLHLLGEPTAIPEALAHLPLSSLGTSGVKLLAVPAG